MRRADIVVLGKVLDALEDYLPINEFYLFMEYLDTYEHLLGKLNKQTADYKVKAEYYREMSRLWRQDNPERSKKHYEDWKARKEEKERLENNDKA